MGYKILVVDDNAQFTKGITDIFEEQGFQTCVAVDGDSFARTYAYEVPDLLIVNIFLGKDSGPEVYDRIMKEYPGVNTPVVFVSEELQATKPSPLIPGRQIALYFKPFKVETLIRDILSTFPEVAQRISYYY